jgi:hypothetical protein
MNATICYDEKEPVKPVPGIYKDEEHGNCVMILPVEGKQTFVHIVFHRSGVVTAHEYTEPQNGGDLIPVGPNGQVELNVSNDD